MDITKHCDNSKPALFLYSWRTTMLKRMRSSRLSKILQSGACFNLILKAFSSISLNVPLLSPVIYCCYVDSTPYSWSPEEKRNKADLKLGWRRFKHFQSLQISLYCIIWVLFHIFSWISCPCSSLTLSLQFRRHFLITFLLVHWFSTSGKSAYLLNKLLMISRCFMEP